MARTSIVEWTARNAMTEQKIAFSFFSLSGVWFLPRSCRRLCELFSQKWLLFTRAANSFPFLIFSFSTSFEKLELVVCGWRHFIFWLEKICHSARGRTGDDDVFAATAEDVRSTIEGYVLAIFAVVIAAGRLVGLKKQTVPIHHGGEQKQKSWAVLVERDEGKTQDLVRIM